MFKKLLRLLFKLVFAPFIIFYGMIYLSVGYLVIFYEWLYDYSEAERNATKEYQAFVLLWFKKWFTKL